MLLILIGTTAMANSVSKLVHAVRVRVAHLVPTTALSKPSLGATMFN